MTLPRTQVHGWLHPLNIRKFAWIKNHIPRCCLHKSRAVHRYMVESGQTTGFPYSLTLPNHTHTLSFLCFIFAPAGQFVENHSKLFIKKNSRTHKRKQINTRRGTRYENLVSAVIFKGTPALIIQFMRIWWRILHTHLWSCGDDNRMMLWCYVCCVCLCAMMLGSGRRTSHKHHHYTKLLLFHVRIQS